VAPAALDPQIHSIGWIQILAVRVFFLKKAACNARRRIARLKTRRKIRPQDANNEEHLVGVLLSKKGLSNSRL
jgi:hypothetical protein